MELKGLKEIIDTLNDKLGEHRVKPVVNKSLRKIAPDVRDDLKETAGTFRGKTGKIVDHVVHGSVSWADANIPTVKIGWRKGGPGDRSRWNIEHLNEFGFTKEGKFHAPRGMGKLQALVDKYETEYPRRVQEELKELLR